VREELLRVFPERKQSGDGRPTGDADDTSAPQQLGFIADADQPMIGRARRGQEVADSVGLEVGCGSASNRTLVATCAIGSMTLGQVIENARRTPTNRRGCVRVCEP
jgi:hypothetical protein